MDLSVIWRLRDLMSAPINRVVSAAQNASRIANSATSAMSRGFMSTARSVNDLRARLDSLRAYRDGLRVGIDTSQISAANVQLRNLQRQMDAINRSNARADGSGGGGTGGMLMGLGKRFLPFLAASSIATGAMGVGKMGMDRETTLARFEQFTGSAENAKSIVGQLNKYADATPYENETMLDIGAKLSMNFGKDKIMPLTKILGDVAGGDAGRLQSIQLALSQVKSLGRMQGMDMMQFTNAQVPMMEYLAKAKNVKIGAVKGLMEDGKISYDDVEKALSIMTNKGGVFFGYMDRMSNTTFGKMSTLIGTVKNKFAELSMSKLPGLNKVIDWAVKFVNNFKPAGDAIMAFGRAFSPLFNAIGQILQALSVMPKTGDGVIDTVNGIATVFNTLAGVVGFVADSVNFLVTAMRFLPFGDTIVQGLVLAGVFTKISTATGLLTSQFAIFAIFKNFSSLSELGVLLGRIPWRFAMTSILAFKMALIDLGVAFAITPIGWVVIAVIALVAAITYAWKNSEKFREVVIRSWEAVKAVWAAMQPYFKMVGNWIAEAWTSVVVFFGKLGNTLHDAKEAILTVWDKFQAKTEGVFTKIGESIKNIIRVALAVATLGISEVAIYAYNKVAPVAKAGYNSKAADDAVKMQEQSRYLNKDRSATEAARAARRAARVAQFGEPLAIAQKMMGMGKSDTAGTGKPAGVSETVEGAKSRTININIKNLVETINNYVDSSQVGKKVGDEVLDALNRILMSGDRLAVE